MWKLPFLRSYWCLLFFSTANKRCLSEFDFNPTWRVLSGHETPLQALTIISKSHTKKTSNLGKVKVIDLESFSLKLEYLEYLWVVLILMNSANVDCLGVSPPSSSYSRFHIPTKIVKDSSKGDIVTHSVCEPLLISASSSESTADSQSLRWHLWPFWQLTKTKTKTWEWFSFLVDFILFHTMPCHVQVRLAFDLDAVGGLHALYLHHPCLACLPLLCQPGKVYGQLSGY